MRKLRAFLLALAAIGCFLLLAVGTLSALFLTFLGILGLSGGISAPDLHLAAVSLFGLVTVGLCSFACFAGLFYLFDQCLTALNAPGVTFIPSLTVMTLLCVAATLCIYLSVLGDWFVPACLFADILHVLFIILYIRVKRGNSHDPNRS